MPLSILYQDKDIIAINKPHGLLVHRSPIAADVAEFAVQMLRDQIGQWVRPAHRLDRKTGGVLLFALNVEMDRFLKKCFEEYKMAKEYIAIVRGHTPDEGTIDYPLRREDGKLQDAITMYKTITRTELDIPFGRYKTSRYSMVAVKPKTGRMHQIRKHFAHIHYPIIADRPHGCNKQNKFFKDRWHMDTMLLHAMSLSFEHPITGALLNIRAPLHSEFERMKTVLGF